MVSGSRLTDFDENHNRNRRRQSLARVGLGDKHDGSETSALIKDQVGELGV
jgi:hypothetical protein